MPDDTLLTDEELAAIEARADAATPGVGFSQSWTWGDAVFVAYARTDIPRLVAEVRRLRETVRWLRGALREIDDMLDLGAALRGAGRDE